MQSRLLHRLRATRWTAVLVGLGGIFAGAGRAAATPEPAVSLRLDGDMIQLAERGGAFSPLALGDTPEARRLHALLRDRGTVGLAPEMIADGGQGFSLDSVPHAAAAAPVAAQAAKPKPQKTGRTVAPKAGSAP